jgi:hypothetical protein
MDMASTTNRKDAAMPTTTTITITLSADEAYMLRTILDIAREDESDGDEFREEVANFAEDLYLQIRQDLAS